MTTTASNATPSFTWGDADAGSTFVFRSAGNEMAAVCPPYTGAAAAQLRGFSLAAGDTLDIAPILKAANVSITTAQLSAYFSTTESNGSTLLWFNPAGTGATPGHGAIVVAVLENTQVSMSQLLSAGALNVGPSITPVTVQQEMKMGCTNNLIDYRLEGHETVCLQSLSHGVQQLAGFNAAMGDVIGLDDILETTLVPDDLAGVGKYITSSVSAAGTTLYFEGSAFAVLQGVDTTVAQLVADGGMQYIPDAIALTPSSYAPFTLRSQGLETVNLLGPEAGKGPEQINGFDPTKGDALQLQKILNPTTAAPDLSNVQNYISAQTVDGATILSLDPTGTGQPGTPFAQLNGVSLTVSQLLADDALVFTPSPVTTFAAGGQAFQFRSEGDETAFIVEDPAFKGFATLQNFSLTNGDALDVAGLLSFNHVSANAADLGNYISAHQSGGSTSLWFDQTGSGHGGVEFALLHNVNTTFAGLTSHNALHLS
jgi:hypothetical protein